MTTSSGWKGVAAGVSAGLVFLAVASRSPWLGLGGLLALAALLAVLRAPGLGMGVLTFLLPLERMQRLTNDDASFTISLMRLVALASFVAIVLVRIHQRRSLNLDRSMLLLGIYVLMATAGMSYSTDPYGTKRFLGTIYSNCLLIFLYFNYLQDRRQVRWMVAIWLAANIAGAGYSAFDWHRGSGSVGEQKLVDPGKGAQTTADRWSTVWEDKTEWDAQGGVGLRRSMGPTSHPSVYGLNLVLTIPFLFALLQRRRKPWEQAGLAVALGLIVYNVFLSNTRATLLGIILTGILCFSFGLVRLRRSHLPVALVGLLLLIFLVPSDTISRMLDPSNYSTEGSSTLRVRIRYWEAGFRILADHFLIGQGVGNERVVPAYLEGEDVGHQSVHNIYLQVAIETGIVGWLGFFGFVGLMYRRAHMAARDVRDRPGWEDEYLLLRAIQVAMLTVLAYGIQVDVFNFSLKAWWLMASITMVLYRWSRPPVPENESVVGLTIKGWRPLPAR